MRVGAVQFNQLPTLSGGNFLLGAAQGMTDAQAASFAAETPPIVTVTDTPSSTYTLAVPVGSYPAGARIKYHITPSQQITFAVDGAIKIPSDSTFANNKVMNSGTLWLVQLEYSGSYWMLTTLVGGYS